MFIEPVTAPERLPPMSMQNAQLGLMVISAPKAAAAKQAVAKATSGANGMAATPAAASRKPIIAGSRRDHARYLDRYIRSTTMPVTHCDVAPTSRGIIA